LAQVKDIIGLIFVTDLVESVSNFESLFFVKMPTDFDPKKKYKIIEEFADSSFNKEHNREILKRPQLGPQIELALNDPYTHIFHFEICRIGTIRNISILLQCGICLSDIKEVCLNENISGETIMKLPFAEKYANPRIWNVIRKNTELLDNLSDDEFYMLCKNPYAISYIEQQPLRINNRRSYSALFNNPGAITFILAQNFSGDFMFMLGTRHPHFYPFFNHELCQESLRGEYPFFLTQKLIKNPAAKELIRQNIVEIVRDPTVHYEEIPKYPHLFDIVVENRHLFGRTKCIQNLNLNTAAVEYLKLHPNLIRQEYLAANEAAIDMIEDYLMRRRRNPHRASSLIYKSLSQNPAAIGLLRKFRKLLPPYTILENPNIFEEVNEKVFYDKWENRWRKRENANDKKQKKINRYGDLYPFPQVFMGMGCGLMLKIVFEETTFKEIIAPLIMLLGFVFIIFDAIYR